MLSNIVYLRFFCIVLGFLSVIFAVDNYPLSADNKIIISDTIIVDRDSAIGNLHIFSDRFGNQHIAYASQSAPVSYCTKNKKETKWFTYNAKNSKLTESLENKTFDTDSLVYFNGNSDKVSIVSKGKSSQLILWTLGIKKTEIEILQQTLVFDTLNSYFAWYEHDNTISAFSFREDNSVLYHSTHQSDSAAIHQKISDTRSNYYPWWQVMVYPKNKQWHFLYHVSSYSTPKVVYSTISSENDTIPFSMFQFWGATNSLCKAEVLRTGYGRIAFQLKAFAITNSDEIVAGFNHYSGDRKLNVMWRKPNTYQWQNVTYPESALSLQTKCFNSAVYVVFTTPTALVMGVKKDNTDNWMWEKIASISCSDVMPETSFDIDVQGALHIVYTDHNNTELKYVKIEPKSSK